MFFRSPRFSRRTAHWRLASGKLQTAVRDEVAEVAIAADQCDVVVDAGLGDERIADFGFEALA
jgi:hypothetical protein